MKKITFLFFLTFLFNSNAQWIQQYSDTYQYYKTIFFIDSLKGWIGGYEYSGDRFILGTTNGGENWEEYLVGDSPASIYFINSNTGFSATGNGIYKSTDGGKTWVQNYPDVVHYNSIEFIGESKGWAVGEYFQDLYLLKTQDGGVSWSKSLLMDGIVDPQIDMVNELTGFIIATGSGKIWKTIDGGDNWLEVYSDSSSGHSFFDISFSDELIGYAGGAGTGFISTTNSGNTWSKKDLPFIFCVDIQSAGSQIWISGFDVENNAIIYSENYGNTWTPVFVGNDQSIHDIFFIDINNGWYCSTKGNSAPLYDGFIYKLEKDWIGNIISPSTPQQVHPANGSFFNVNIIDFEWEQIDYSTYRLQVSNDSLFNNFFVFIHNPTGDTLFDGNTLYLQNNRQIGLFPNKKYYWRVRSENHKGVSDWSETWSFIIYSPTNVEEENITADFKLFQNFPNPFNPTTKISWQSPVGATQTLKIYDVLGNEVVTLVNEYKPAGSHEVEWNANGLVSGIYIVRLQAGNFTDNKKIILLK